METTSQAEPSLLDSAERRGEYRFRAEGSVRLFLCDSIRLEFSGELIDYSRSGFRAIHNYTALTAGRTVFFEHLLAAGHARVAWNRILAGYSETGFITQIPQRISLSDKTVAYNSGTW